MNDASQEIEWYLAREGKRYGPISKKDLLELLSSGQLKGEDLVWRQGFAEWMQANDVPELVGKSSSQPEQSNSTVFPESDTFSSQSAEDLSGSRNMASSADGVDTGFRADPTFRADQSFERGTQDVPSGDDAFAASRPDQNFAPQAAQAPVRRKSFARRFFTFVLFLLVLAGGAIFAVPAFLPADFIRERVARVIKEQTGRTLTVRGKSTFSIVPHLGVKMFDASLSNPPSMRGEPLLQTSMLEVQLKLWPLLERKVEIERVLLKAPKLTLRQDGRGRQNWAFEKGPLSSSDGSAEEASTDDDASSTIDVGDSGVTIQVSEPEKPKTISFDPYLKLKDIKLEAVQIQDGVISYQDEKSGLFETVSDINVTVTLTSSVKRLLAEGAGRWKNETIEYSLSLDSPQQISKGEKSPYNLTLKSKLFSAILLGDVSWADGIYITGKGSELQVASARNLARWLDHEIAPGSGMEAFSIQGDFSAQSHRVALSNTTISLDNTSATGEATLFLSRKKPFVKAQLSADTLDLNPYFNEKPLRESGLSSPEFQYANQQGDSGAYYRQANQTDEDDNGFRTGDSVQEDGDDGEAISARPVNTFASSLNLFDAEIELLADKVIYENMIIGKSRALLKVSEGVMNANIPEINLYSGTASGKFTLSGTTVIPRFSGDVKINNVAALPLLRDSQEFDWVSGKANVKVSIASKGNTSKQFISSMSGKGSVDLVDGAIVGIDIPGKLKDARRGKIGDLTRNRSERTRFETLTGTFKIKKGVLKNKDLKMVAPNVSIDAAGYVDLTRNWIDYRVEPNLGTNNRNKSDKLAVPVTIKGPVERPSVNLDLDGAIDKNQDAIVKGVNNIVKNLKKYQKKNKKVDFEALIQDALGGGDDDKDDNF